MAQSTEKGRTILGLEPFWERHSSNPPPHSMGKVEKSTQDGPRRKDKHRTR